MIDFNDSTETTNLTPAADSAADSAANSANDSYTAPDVKDAEFGYFKDATIKNSNHSLRVFSKPDSVSTFAVSEGRLLKAANKIALDSAEQDKYAIDSTIKVTERPDSEQWPVIHSRIRFPLNRRKPPGTANEYGWIPRRLGARRPSLRISNLMMRRIRGSTVRCTCLHVIRPTNRSRIRQMAPIATFQFVGYRPESASSAGSREYRCLFQ